jgi:hypothetical protein
MQPADNLQEIDMGIGMSLAGLQAGPAAEPQAPAAF